MARLPGGDYTLATSINCQMEECDEETMEPAPACAGSGCAGRAGVRASFGQGAAPESPGDVAPDAGAGETGDDNVPLTYNGLDVSGLSSYRSQFVFTLVGTDETGAPVDLRWTLNEARSTNPPADSRANGSSPRRSL